VLAGLLDLAVPEADAHAATALVARRLLGYEAELWRRYARQPAWFRQVTSDAHYAALWQQNLAR
jgi:hypothetical protein